MHPWLAVTQRHHEIIAEGVMQPLEGMRAYRVRITYREGRFPRAEVLDPQPQRRIPERPVAHTNGADHVPCLFTPTNGDWRPSMWLSNTVVPWLGEWLVFYEGWLTTGTWHGGGVLPSSCDQKPEPEAPAA
jgi:hypothetical protein